jgi:hypothetical protein
MLHYRAAENGNSTLPISAVGFSESTFSTKVGHVGELGEVDGGV